MIERIAVLSPGHPDTNGQFLDWDYDDTYVGGDKRLQAAALVADTRPDAECWLVGGLNVEKDTTQHAVPYSDKTRSMGRYMCGLSSDSQVWRRLRDVPSLPCTYHNFVALLSRMEHAGEFDSLELVDLTVVTNDYHIPRSQLLLAVARQDVLSGGVKPNLHVRWVGAETLLGVSLQDLSGARQAQYDERLRREANGLRILQEGGEYTDSCRQYNDGELGRMLLLAEREGKHPPLLAPKERAAWQVCAPL